MFPVVLDLTGRRVVVVGGGAVGRRKAAAAVAAGAAVRVIDPTAPPGAGPQTPDPAVLSTQYSVLEWIAEPYRPDHLTGAALVFACATPEVNARVVADAQARGVWVNAASEPGQGDFHLPAVVRRGGLTLAVGTGGASPALARRIREKLETEFDESFAVWVALLDEARAEVLAAVPDPARRRELLDGFADWPWLARLRAEGVAAVRAAMREAVRTAAGRL
ncbi:MAG: bifunctional precorrin-2 dehydrogenase/sirohydrochlorin ferrochelatase [Gemmataceae bacterium]|nr:bifunctional precorrin-2 dehydrogenase/sirohydrochlorin ferrochelatase [Gemmataceae bacterium]